MGTRLTSKGQVTIPVSVREALGLRTGDEVEFVLDDLGRVNMVRSDRLRRLEEAFERIARDPPIKRFTTDEVMSMTRGDDR